MKNAVPTPGPVAGTPPLDLAWLLLLIPLALAVKALVAYPTAILKGPDQVYAMFFSAASLVKMAAVFYGLYWLPGLIFFAIRVPTDRFADKVSSARLLTAFALGMTAHVLALFPQKYLHLSYQPPIVLLCLFFSYGLLFWLLQKVPLGMLFRAESPARENSWEAIAAFVLLALALVLGIEMTLRGRASSLSLTGDGYPHLINTLGTIADGPLPDGMPFFSTFVLNIHPMGFHALLANLKILTPGLLYIDLFRYFSVLMIPVFLACMYGFFAFLGKSRVVGAVCAFAALLVSGGGLSLRIPIAYFPWYWGIAWCLSAGVFYMLLKSRLSSVALCFAAGLVFGAGVLLHPFFAIRMGIIMVFFLPLEMLRRAYCKEGVLPLLSKAAVFALGLAIPVGAWIIPLLLRHSLEETYDYDYIVKNFSAVAPEAIDYLKAMQGSGFHVKDLWSWIWLNAGLLPACLAPLGLIAIPFRIRESAAALLPAWILAMLSAILFDYLPNPYRYFEYFFFGLTALAAFGTGCLLQFSPKIWRKLVVVGLLCFSALQISRDFFPKYRLALNLYGTTAVTEANIRSAESRAYAYLASKKAGRLDLEYGGYRGYLWSRQKKVWDIYLKTKKPVAQPPQK